MERTDFKRLDLLVAIPLKLHWITAPVSPILPSTETRNAVGRCDESAQSVVTRSLCARALPYPIPQGEDDDRYTLSAARSLDTRCAWDSVRASSHDRAGGGRHVARECHRRKRCRDSRRDDHRD